MYEASSYSKKQYCNVIGTITNCYPIVILNVDISSFANKVVHYFNVAFFCCHMQGSHLIERETIDFHASILVVLEILDVQLFI